MSDRLRLCAICCSLVGCGDNVVVGPTCDEPERGPMFEGLLDVTSYSGVQFRYASQDFKGGALALADFDNDGRDDILAGTRTGGVALYRNVGRMRFEPVESGIDPTLQATAVAAADLDNDGDTDVVLATHGTTRVFENRGKARFDLAAELTATGNTEHVVVVDLDNDGLLDVYLGNYDVLRLEDTTNQFFWNRGGMRFELGLKAGLGRTWTTTAFDFDGDGDQDLYLANDTLAYDFGNGPEGIYAFPVDQLLRNDGVDASGKPILTDIAADVGLTEARSSMSGTLGDFDRDGVVDLYVTNWGVKKLFVRTADGYREEGAALGLASADRRSERCLREEANENCLLLSWSALLTDLDLDGNDEMIVTNGETQVGGPPPVQLFARGDADAFHEMSSGIACSNARAALASDLDGDGDDDVVIAPKDGDLLVYENLRSPRPDSSLVVRLRGTASNRDGIGAEVTIRQASGRTQTRVIGTGGTIHASAAISARFGLGSDAATEVRVRWPGGATTTVVPTQSPMLVTE